MNGKRRSHFSDILTDPKSGLDVWTRDLWDGGEAFVITRRDEHHDCPVCEGSRTVTKMGPVRGNEVEPPEYEDACPTCSGSGEVTALFGTDDDNQEVLLWPRDAEDAEAGCDDL